MWNNEYSIHSQVGERLGMLPILGIRIGLYYDLFTEACISDLPTKEKIVLPMSGIVIHLMNMSLSFFFLFVFVFRRKKLEIKYQGGKQD